MFFSGLFDEKSKKKKKKHLLEMEIFFTIINVFCDFLFTLLNTK